MVYSYSCRCGDSYLLEAQELQELQELQGAGSGGSVVVPCRWVEGPAGVCCCRAAASAGCWHSWWHAGAVARVHHGCLDSAGWLQLPPCSSDAQQSMRQACRHDLNPPLPLPLHLQELLQLRASHV